MPDRPAHSTLPEVCIAFVMAVAAVVVLAPHLHRSAFYDEAWVVDAALSPTVSDGWAALVRDTQPAAVGYTALLHAAGETARPSIALFRGVTAFFGFVAVLLAMRLVHSWRCGGIALVFAAAVLLAMPRFQHYATEIKQYVIEAAFAMGLIVAAQTWVTGPADQRRRAAWCWFIVALTALLMTFSAWFAVAGSGIVVGLATLLRRDWPQVKRATVFAIAIAAAAAVLHTQFNRYLSGSTRLEGFWAEYFLPLDASWPAKTWTVLSKTLKDCWYRYDKIPGDALLVLAILGFAAWVWRQSVSGLAALATVLITLAASTAKAWPLNLRVNMHLIVILHIAIIAGPVVLASLLHQRLAASHVSRFTAILPWLALLLALAVTAGLYRESRSAKFEVVAVGTLLDHLEKSTTDNDIVILPLAATVNQALEPHAIRGTIRYVTWVAPNTIQLDFFPLIALPMQRPVVFAVDHHKAHSGVPQAFAELGQALSPFGRFSQQRFDGDEKGDVAVYRFDPTPR